MARYSMLFLLALASDAYGAEFLAITSSSCPPCQAMRRDYKDDARITWLDATAEARERHKVRSVPTVIATRDGAEIGRHVGYHGRREMDRWIKSMEAPHASQAGAISPATHGAAARH